MSGSPEKPWSNNPYAPLIPYGLHAAEKSDFVGLMISAILYGIVVVLFFQCMAALLDPANRTKGGMRWGLVAHAVLMFLLVTVNTAMTFNYEFVCYIANRAFPGNSQILFPGPISCQLLNSSEAIFVVPGLMYQLNQWLADGLLFYRCHIIYGMNYWVMTLPCLMYLASMATGIVLICIEFRPGSYLQELTTVSHFQTSYVAISLALNLLLTLMIVVRLTMHARNMRNTLGTQATADGLHKGIVAILIESFALYSVTLLLFTALNAANNPSTGIFNQIGPMAQAIAPFLIIVRVAKRRAVTSGDICSAGIGSIHFKSRGESTDDDGAIPDGNSTDLTEKDGESPSEPSVRDENAIEEVPQ